MVWPCKKLRYENTVACTVDEGWSQRWNVEGQQVGQRRPAGQVRGPKKTWSNQVVEEDMTKLNITKIWQKIENSGGNSYHIQPQEWETKDI